MAATGPPGKSDVSSSYEIVISDSIPPATREFERSNLSLSGLGPFLGGGIFGTVDPVISSRLTPIVKSSLSFPDTRSSPFSSGNLQTRAPYLCVLSEDLWEDLCLDKSLVGGLGKFNLGPPKASSLQLTSA